MIVNPGLVRRRIVKYHINNDMDRLICQVIDNIKIVEAGLENKLMTDKDALKRLKLIKQKITEKMTTVKDIETYNKYNQKFERYINKIDGIARNLGYSLSV